MELIGRRKSIRGPVKRAIISNSVEPCHDLLLYTTPPISTVPLGELYDLALDRMKVLKILEQTLSRGASKNMEERKTALLHEFKKQGLKTYAKLLVSNGSTAPTESDLQARTEDHISHFIVRLAHCHSVNLRRWFVSREVELFRLRFTSLNAEGIRSFLAAYKLEFTAIPPEEKSSLMSHLVSSTYNVTHASVESMDFFRVPFTDVSDLVAHRKVFLKAGYAYIPSRDLLSIVMTVFKRNLQMGLGLAASGMAYLEEDERLRTLIKLHEFDMSDVHDRPQNTNQVLPEDLDYLSTVSFPPCMRQLHESIRSTHHAKHGTRQQYGLFLKSIGVTLDDAIRFWRDEFTKTMSLDKFEKQYMYNIRHNYGQEGKRTSYSSYSCRKIISGAVGTGDCHGCPFKHNSSQILKKQLESYGIPIVDIPSIMEFVSQHQYELACTKYFEIKHPKTPVEVIYHPKQYFDLSRKYHVGDEQPANKKSIPINHNSVSTNKGTSGSTCNNVSSLKDKNADSWDPWGNEETLEIDSFMIEEANALEKAALQSS